MSCVFIYNHTVNLAVTCALQAKSTPTYQQHWSEMSLYTQHYKCGKKTKDMFCSSETGPLLHENVNSKLGSAPLNGSSPNIALRRNGGKRRTLRLDSINLFDVFAVISTKCVNGLIMGGRHTIHRLRFFSDQLDHQLWSSCVSRSKASSGCRKAYRSVSHWAVRRVSVSARDKTLTLWPAFRDGEVMNAFAYSQFQPFSYHMIQC